jgi:transposase
VPCRPSCRASRPSSTSRTRPARLQGRAAPDREDVSERLEASQPIAHHSGFKGVLQVDGYAGYGTLADKGDVSLDFCWAHLRRRFYERPVAEASPIANEALQRIAALYRMETDIRGRTSDAPSARDDCVRFSPNSNGGCAKSSRSSAGRVSSPRRSACALHWDRGGENWAVIASLIEACKLSGVDPTPISRTRL